MGDELGNFTTEDQFEGETVTLGAKLDCEVIDLEDIRFTDFKPHESGSVLNKTLDIGSSQAICASNQDAIVVIGPGSLDNVCQNGTSALELVLTMDAANANATQEDKDACMRTIILGWIRNPEGSCKSAVLTAETAKESLFIQCQPRLLRGKQSSDLCWNIHLLGVNL